MTTSYSAEHANQGNLKKQLQVDALEDTSGKPAEEGRDRGELPDRADSWIDVGDMMMPHSPQQQEDGDSVIIHTTTSSSVESAHASAAAQLLATMDHVWQKADEEERHKSSDEAKEGQYVLGDDARDVVDSAVQREDEDEGDEDENKDRRLPSHHAALPSSSSVASLLASEFKHLSPLATGADAPQHWPSRHAAGSHPTANAAADLMSSPKKSACNDFPQPYLVDEDDQFAEETAVPQQATLLRELRDLLEWKVALHSFAAAACLVALFGIFIPYEFGSDGAGHGAGRMSRLTMYAMAVGWLESKSSSRSSPVSRLEAVQKLTSSSLEAAQSALTACIGAVQSWETSRLAPESASRLTTSPWQRKVKYALHWTVVGFLTVTITDAAVVPVLCMVSDSSLSRLVLMVMMVMFLQTPAKVWCERYGPAIAGTALEQQAALERSATGPAKVAALHCLRAVCDAVFAERKVRPTVTAAIPAVVVLLCGALG